MRPLLTCLAALVLSLGLPAWGDAGTSASEAALTAFAPTTTQTDTGSDTGPVVPLNQDDAGEEAADPADAEAVVEESDAAAAVEEAAAEVFDAESAVADAVFRTDNLWILIAAFLVFIMHLGFATLESGLTQAKNTTNILFKNVMIVCIGLLTYGIAGFNLMYHGAFNGYLGFAGFGLSTFADSDNTVGYAGGYAYWTDFIFQGMFAATAATIISGCVAERIKLLPFLIFATIYVGFLYPWVGSWKWGGGWLDQMGFYDFAGSTLVHSVGGWGGLAAILVLGPRKGKYVDGQVRPILPSNLPLATIGVLLLWFGWFGFNGGSQLDADPGWVGYVVTTTSIAAAVGGIVAACTSWIVGGKPDLTMALNGILAGLVGITAAPDTTLTLAIIVGLVCGVAVYFAVLLFDAIKIDDPVGALSVHLVCGIIGTLFAAGSLNLPENGGVGVQLVGVLAYGAASFIFALIFAFLIKAILGWRVSEEEEVEGLDAGEHGMSAYHGISVQ